ncbi:MAG TPA: VOC family protein [Kofleriaceae bacterium]|jgi:catechol 2,3-dioxygenase-like lactoylglutathione lyase family enzyme
MHRSRLVQLFLDCDEKQVTMEEAVRFWTGALGLTPDDDDEPGDRYRGLRGREGLPRIGLQQVQEPSAIHLDIETDDVEAEVKRLEALGAVRKRQVKTWWVMRAPTGHTFCVVRPQTDDFPGDANVWDD